MLLFCALDLGLDTRLSSFVYSRPLSSSLPLTLNRSNSVRSLLGCAFLVSQCSFQTYADKPYLILLLCMCMFHVSRHMCAAASFNMWDTLTSSVQKWREWEAVVSQTISCITASIINGCLVAATYCIYDEYNIMTWNCTTEQTNTRPFSGDRKVNICPIPNQNAYHFWR